MGRGPFHALSSVLLAASMLLCQPGTAASDLSDQEIRGRALFLTGRTDEPAPYAAVGAGNVQLPATAVPCGSCHGRDGLGGAERGGWPPNITWPVLSAPDVTPGRTRPPYSETLVVRADHHGHRCRRQPTGSGHAALPPVDGRCGGPARLHQASRHPASSPGWTTTRSYWARSWVHTTPLWASPCRPILPRSTKMAGCLVATSSCNVEHLRPASRLARSIARLTKSADIFALLAPAIAGDERNAVAAADADGVPMIGPSTPSAQTAPRSRYVFYLERRRGGRGAGARRLCRHLARLAVDRRRSARAVWHAAALAAVAKLSADSKPLEPLRPDDPALFAGNGPVLWFADSAPNDDDIPARTGIRPALLLPGALAADALSHGAPAQTWLAFAAGPPDIAADAVAEYRELAARLRPCRRRPAGATSGARSSQNPRSRRYAAPVATSRASGWWMRWKPCRIFIPA